MQRRPRCKTYSGHELLVRGPKLSQVRAVSEQVEKKGHEIALQWKRAPKIGATVAVAADPGLLPLPSSEDGVEPSPDDEAELLAEPSDSDTAARGDAFAGNVSITFP